MDQWAEASGFFSACAALAACVGRMARAVADADGDEKSLIAEALDASGGVEYLSDSGAASGKPREAAWRLLDEDVLAR